MFRNQTADSTQYGNQFGGCGRGFGGFRGQKFGKANPWMKHFAERFGNRIPVNIEENLEAYVLHVYAAGLAKENFSIGVKDDVLTVSHKAPETDENKYTHNEYNPGNFDRSFQLNGKVLVEAINAAYADGVLKVILPKNPDTTKPAQEVKVK